MKVSDFIKALEEIKKEHGDLELIYSSDDEGNEFDRVCYSPSVGNWNFHNREWLDESEMAEKNDEIAGHNEVEKNNKEFLLEINAACIN